MFIKHQRVINCCWHFISWHNPYIQYSLKNLSLYMSKLVHAVTCDYYSLWKSLYHRSTLLDWVTSIQKEIYWNISNPQSWSHFASVKNFPPTKLPGLTDLVWFQIVHYDRYGGHCWFPNVSFDPKFLNIKSGPRPNPRCLFLKTKADKY